MKIFTSLLRTVNADIWQDAPPDLDMLITVAIRVVNFLLFSGGVVLVIMILLSAYKFAMAQGDPKGVDGAKKTLTYSVIGFVLIIGIFTILRLLVVSLGADARYSTTTGLFGSFTESINFLKDFAHIQN